MKLLLLANNRVGLEITKYLANQGADIVGLIVHAPDKQKFTDGIIEASGLDKSKIFDGSKLNDSEVFEAIKALEAGIAISALFDYIIKKDFLDLFPSGCVNIHPAYLPYNRGSYPNIFSIVEGTPAGATMHYMDEKIDTGDIVARKEVEVEATDTGKSLYTKLEDACIELFKETWPLLEAGKTERIPQKADEGTTHVYKDVDAFDEIDPEREYKAKDLINIIRARTFAPYKGAYITSKGKKVYLRLELIDEDSL